MLAKVRNVGVLIEIKDAIRLANALFDGVPVVRAERSQVDDLRLDSISGHLFGDLNGNRHHATVADERPMTASAAHPRLADGDEEIPHVLPTRPPPTPLPQP